MNADSPGEPLLEAHLCPFRTAFCVPTLLWRWVLVAMSITMLIFSVTLVALAVSMTTQTQLIRDVEKRNIEHQTALIASSMTNRMIQTRVEALLESHLRRSDLLDEARKKKK
jgi:hypothetical protein